AGKPSQRSLDQRIAAARGWLARDSSGKPNQRANSRNDAKAEGEFQPGGRRLLLSRCCQLGSDPSVSHSIIFLVDAWRRLDPDRLLMNVPNTLRANRILSR